MQTNTHTDMYGTSPKHLPVNTDNVLRAKKQLAADFDTLVSDAEALLKSTASYSGESLAAARGRFQDTLDHFKTRISDAQDSAVGKFNQAATATQGYVRENPWKVVGTAALVGMVIGVLMQRR
jgi:ElaB/YqjD/DUF883 family membrane-anchored ribosome-binding protein